ncbi:MAG: CotH kinase family protein [Paludibacteraceae bacterium]|nr:CotH kinase family protein [Paludibacteraceae bacterium]
MKKTLQSIIVLSLLLCGASAYAQPNYLAGSSKFDGLSSAVPSGSNITVEMRSSGNVGSKTVSANANADNVWFKFANGNTGWMPQWASCDYGVSKHCELGQVYTACRSNDGSAMDLTLNVRSGRYYTFNVTYNVEDNNFAVIETQSEPVGIWSVTEISKGADKPTELNVVLSAEKSEEEILMLAYKSQGGVFATTYIEKEGSTYRAEIPAEVNVDGATVYYMVYTTKTAGLNPEQEGFDLLCIKQSKLYKYTVGEPTPEEPEAPVISAHRDVLNPRDFTDFASLYISSYGGLSDNEKYTGSYSLEWQKSTDGGSSWASYEDGKKYDTNNIRPVAVGDYRVHVSRQNASTGDYVTTTSNVITVTDGGGSSKSISTNLPIVIVRTDAEDFPDATNVLNKGNEALAAAKKKISVDVKIIWDETSTDDVTNTYTGDDRTNPQRLYYDRKARMNYRGSSSMANERKNYAFVVGDDSCTIKGKWVKDKKNMFNLNKSKDKDFILYASASDGTYMRNMLSLDLYEDMTGEWNSHGRYVRLFVNGEDRGIYIFMEKNKQDKNRINVGENGYVFKYDKTDIVDRASSTEGGRSTFVTSRTGKTDIQTYALVVDQAFEIVYPEYDAEEYTDDAWDGVVSTLRGRITEFENALSGSNYAQVRELIDYRSWADNFIINEFTMNYDGYRISQFFKLNSLDDKIQASPLWDMELGYGAQLGTIDGFLYQTEWVAHEYSFPIPFWWDGYTSAGTHVGGGYGLMADDCFKAKIRQQWERHTADGGALTESNIVSRLSKYSEAVGISYNNLKNWTNSRRTNLGNLISQFPKYLKGLSLDGDKTVDEGETASFRATVSGTGSYSYKWFFRAEGEKEWTQLETMARTLTLAGVTPSDAGEYKCVAEYSGCECVSEEAVATLTVNADPMGADEENEASCEVYASNGVIHIACPDAKDVVVTDTVGVVISKGGKDVAVPCSGVYLVSVNGSVTKILVR